MNAMSEAISEKRMVVCAVAVAIFAGLVYFAVQWRSTPPPPPETGKVLLQRIESGK
jgi:hypothetical protein